MTAPVAAFSADETDIRAGATVTFTDASTNTPTSWAWDFGDAGTSTSQNPTHVFAAAGVYAVLLTATNADGSDAVAAPIVVHPALGTGKLRQIMVGLADLLNTAGIAPSVFDYPVESVSPPCAVVGYPTTTEFDVTFKRGGDRFVFPVWVMVGKTTSGDARDRLSAILDDATSVKATLDGAHDFGSVRVTDASIEEVAVGGVSYLSAKFDVEVLA